MNKIFPDNKYSTEILNDIQEEAKHGHSFKEIALRLNIPVSEFIDDYFNPLMQVRQYYDTGRSMGITEINDSLFRLAANHSNAAQLAYQKRITATKLENKINEIENL